MRYFLEQVFHKLFIGPNNLISLSLLILKEYNEEEGALREDTMVTITIEIVITKWCNDKGEKGYFDLFDINKGVQVVIMGLHELKAEANV